MCVHACKYVLRVAVYALIVLISLLVYQELVHCCTVLQMLLVLASTNAACYRHMSCYVDAQLCIEAAVKGTLLACVALTGTVYPCAHTLMILSRYNTQVHVRYNQ
jgi:serine kinase of HPr protein (carbohydrate metabolism regulator)